MINTDSDNSREWAAQAYALLKKRQEDQKQELKEGRGSKTRIKEGRGSKTRLRRKRIKNKN